MSFSNDIKRIVATSLCINLGKKVLRAIDIERAASFFAKREGAFRLDGVRDKRVKATPFGDNSILVTRAIKKTLPLDASLKEAIKISERFIASKIMFYNGHPLLQTEQKLVARLYAAGAMEHRAPYTIGDFRELFIRRFSQDSDFKDLFVKKSGLNPTKKDLSGLDFETLLSIERKMGVAVLASFVQNGYKETVETSLSLKRGLRAEEVIASADSSTLSSGFLEVVSDFDQALKKINDGHVSEKEAVSLYFDTKRTIGYLERSLDGFSPKMLLNSPKIEKKDIYLYYSPKNTVKFTYECEKDIDSKFTKPLLLKREMLRNCRDIFDEEKLETKTHYSVNGIFDTKEDAVLKINLLEEIKSGHGSERRTLIEKSRAGMVVL